MSIRRMTWFCRDLTLAGVALGLSTDAIPDSAKGAAAIEQVLSGLAQSSAERPSSETSTAPATAARALAD
jgi:hypothetical protein